MTKRQKLDLSFISFSVEMEMQQLLELCVGEARQVREYLRHYITEKRHQVRGRWEERRRKRKRERVYNVMYLYTTLVIFYTFYCVIVTTAFGHFCRKVALFRGSGYGEYLY